MKKSKKKFIIILIACVTFIAGAAVAVFAYFKKHAKDIGEVLDYDGDIYDDMYDDCQDFSSECEEEDNTKQDNVEQDDQESQQQEEEPIQTDDDTNDLV